MEYLFVYYKKKENEFGIALLEQESNEHDQSNTVAKNCQTKKCYFLNEKDFSKYPSSIFNGRFVRLPLYTYI